MLTQSQPQKVLRIWYNLEILYKAIVQMSSQTFWNAALLTCSKMINQLFYW